MVARGWEREDRMMQRIQGTFRGDGAVLDLECDGSMSACIC